MVFQEYMIVQLIFFILVLSFFTKEIYNTRQLKSKEDQNTLYLLYPILLIGILVRTINLTYPHGVNVDEAMGAYDSWCLANYGVDSNLASFPVYLRSWGAGQSALYAYLALPFIKLFGLSPEVYRLPTSLLGCISLLFSFWTLNKVSRSKLLTFTISFFLAINPWHILKSRFGLDCNIFPDILLIGICFLLLAYYSISIKRQTILNILGFSIISISAYAYGVSWFMLPFLYISLVVFFIKKGKITKKAIIGSAIISSVLLLPLLLFCYSLVFGGEQYKIGPITITTLLGNRIEETSSLANTSIASLIKDSLKTFVLGSDMYPLNTIYPFGYFYNFISFPAFIAGIYYTIKEKNPIFRIFLLWFICTIPIMIAIGASIYHWNALWFPMIFLAGYGLYKICHDSKKVQYFLLSVYSFMFLLFLNAYTDNRSYNPFDSYTYGNEVKYTMNLKSVEKIYYPEHCLHSYALFYAPVDPYTYAQTKKTQGFPMVFATSYANIEIGLPDKIEPLPSTGYVIHNALLSRLDLTQFKIKKGEYYSVIWND